MSVCALYDIKMRVGMCLNAHYMILKWKLVCVRMHFILDY